MYVYVASYIVLTVLVYTFCGFYDKLAAYTVLNGPCEHSDLTTIKYASTW